MKPVKLTIEGVNSFIEPQTLDFEAAGRSNLFCISGKTGAGKTTIFDSIMLALYGKSTKGNLADVVNLSLMSARVVLDFSERGESYTVERTIKCRYEKNEGGEKTEKRVAVSDCLLYKNGAPFAKGEEANAVIADIIGLESAEFKNVYLLEQGEYAEFLKKTPAKQTEAVGKIFSLMRFGDVHKTAGDRERELLRRVEAKTAEAEKLGDASPQKLTEQKDIHKTLKAKTTALVHEAERRAAELAVLEKTRDEYIAVREKQNAVKNLMLQADDAKKNEFTAKTELAEFEKAIDPADGQRLDALRAELNRLSELKTLDTELAATEKDMAAKIAIYEGKKNEVAAVEQKKQAEESKLLRDRAALTDKLKEFSAVAGEIKQKSHMLEQARACMTAENVTLAEIAEIRQRLISEADRYAALDESRKKWAAEVEAKRGSCENRLAAIEQYAATLAELQRQAEHAEAVVEQSEKALAAARLCSHAAAVRAELCDGDVCPVCGGKYSGGVESGDTDVDKRKAEAEQAKAELKKAEQAKADCAKHSDRAKSEYEGFSTALKAAQSELEQTEQKMRETFVVPEIYNKLIALTDESKAAAEAVQSSADVLARRLPELTRLAAECAAAATAVDEAKQKAEKYALQLGDDRGKTSEAIEKVKIELEELENKIKQADGQRQKLENSVRAATATVEAINAALTSAQAECPVDMPIFDEELYIEKKDGSERLKKQISENERDIAVKEVEIAALAEKCAALAELKKETAELKRRAELYGTIAEITRGKAMLNFVAAEYIAEFTAIASEILNELSSGKYTMSYDKTNGFIVYDYLNGGKSRKTDTLSGGELFLASLSVAIAIARTQSNGNNAFFFLDEGFGTLDEELIDVVYGALESLSKDCLVGVITHAEALISRMPSCVTVVEATDTCGSRIV